MEKIINTELITDFMQKHKLSKNAFCKLCKIGPRTLDNILADKMNLRLNMLFKIKKVLKIEIYELFI